MKSILTIGDGIAAWCLNYYLQDFGEVSQISEDKTFGNCSMNSTSINCLRSARPGLSPLGDLLIASHQEFLEFFAKHQPDGFVESEEMAFFKEGSKLARRYYRAVGFEPSHKYIKDFDYQSSEPAYLVSPEKLKLWFESQTPNVKKIKGRVLEVTPKHGKVLVRTSYEELIFDEVYLASSYWTKLLAQGFSEEFDTYLDYSKEVVGQYLEIAFKELGLKEEKDICFSIEGKHLILKPSQGVAQLGSASEIGNCIHPSPELAEIYNFIQAHVKFDLPSFNKWEFRAGVRMKGRKRTPYWGKIAPGIFTVCGLYKNGYSFAFKAARELTSQRTPS